MVQEDFERLHKFLLETEGLSEVEWHETTTTAAAVPEEEASTLTAH